MAGRFADGVQRWAWPAFLCVVAAVGAFLVARHTEGVNGPEYWSWQWRNISPFRTALRLLPCVVLFCLAQWRFERNPGAVAVPLILTTTSLFLLEVVAVSLSTESVDLARMRMLIQSSDATGYFADAVRLRREPDLLQRFAEFVPRLELHPSTHPPGGILYYMALLAIAPDQDSAAMIGGILIGLATAGLVPALYCMALTLGAGRQAAFHAASVAVLWPAVAMFFPQFDQAYATITCLLLACWARALGENDRRASAGAGVLLAVACFFTYAMTLSVLLLAAWTASWLSYAPSRTTRRALAHIAVAGVTFIGAYLLLWLLTGFDPFATLAACLRAQEKFAATRAPSWYERIPNDLLDFALGAGWVPVLLFLSALVIPDVDSEPPAAQRLSGAAPPDALQRFLLGYCVVIVLIAVVGLLPVETSRLWLFLTPGVLLGAGWKLQSWSRAPRAMVYGFMWITLASLFSNVRFM